MARWVIGVDLGTTNTALAAARLDATGGVETLAIPQLVARGTLEERPLLPSFLYFAHESEGTLALPWDATRTHAVGELARARAVEAPARVVSSAKSWLCHPGVDRRAALLPQGAPEDVEKVSPVEASFRYLDHLAEAWQAERARGDAELALAAQELVITVPASFDAAARDLTVEAALAAGFENVTLLEEPQAALYAWIDASGERWRRELRAGDVLLVIDVGGGTTDFSAIAVEEQHGALELRRIAVGDHILLGGDNMDLALAHLVKAKLEARGKPLDRLQLGALAHACRDAKERLLGDGSLGSAPIVVAGRGSQLLGGALRSELTRAELERTLLDGFFPPVPAGSQPVARPRAALTQLGLPYAADAAITRHLSGFLARQAGAAAGSGALLHPTAVLFNGGVTRAAAVRERLLAALRDWLAQDGAAPPRVLPGDDPDLAVARGAAYYGLVRHGRGLRIRGGTARAYYVGIESPAPAVPGVEPPILALCVAPFGMEEGTEARLPARELGVVVGEPVSFRFFGSSVRRDDPAGLELDAWQPGELEELSPIQVVLPAQARREGDVVRVTLRAQVTPVGTLLIEALPVAPLRDDERWKVELSVRS
jgi:molecular chaperone DnaK (HSP70)